MEFDLQLTIEQADIDLEDYEERINAKVERLKKKINSYTNLAWMLIAVGGVSGFYGLIQYSSSKSTAGDFTLNLLGDYLSGTVASLWSLAGLFFIYVAFLGQKQQLLHQELEIKYNQIALKRTRFELKGQREEMIRQNAMLNKQNFENTFFHLLKNHINIVNQIDLRKRKDGNIIAQGRDCFKIFYNTIRKLTENFESSKEISEIGTDDVIKIYDIFYENNQSNLGHYFINIYHIIKFIDESGIDDPEKYTAFIRSQLSSYELIISFYHCLSTKGLKEFKPLVEKYSMLKNIDTNQLFSTRHAELYESKTYS